MAPRRLELLASPLVPTLALLLCHTTLAQPAGTPPGHETQGRPHDGSLPDIYPAGRAFPLGLYALQAPERTSAERQAGWNLAHTYYAFGPAYVAAADSAGYRVLANLPGEGAVPPDEELIGLIRTLAALDAVGWWDLPEERRYWVEAEMRLVRDLSAWTREHDPARRPRYMYIPGHYDAEDIAPYVPYVDVVPASIYTTYNDQPHAWARWRMEETLAGIARAGATVGPDYLAGEKTAVAVLELFYDGDGPEMTPEGAYHDFWLSVACGARGVLVSSHAYRSDSPALAASWARLGEAAAQLSGPEGVGVAFLFGTDVAGVAAGVLAGPERTPPFVPSSSAADSVAYPSVKVAARRYEDDLYLIAVNSAEGAVTAELSGLPPGVTAAALPFEAGSVPVASGRLMLSFPSLGVHVIVVRSAFPASSGTPPAPAALLLGAARPNPAGPGAHATLVLTLPATDRIEAALYDLLGRRVAVLHDGPLTAGSHRLELVTAGLPAGLYVVRVQGQAARVSRPITLVR